MPRPAVDCQAQAMDRKSYEIRVQGTFDPGWADWFGDRELREEEGDTVLVLRDVDNSAFYGAMAILGALDRRLVYARVCDPCQRRNHEES